MATTTTSVSAIVAYNPSEPGKCDFKYTTVELTKPSPGPNEVLVRMLASGICHTDIFVGGVPEPMMGLYPKILGHEGSGYVEAVGSAVKSVSVGDPVLLSYTYCGECDLCTSKDDGPIYCQRFGELNAVCIDRYFKGQDGKEIGAKFFGQSSYASLSIVDEKCIVSVKGIIKDDDELKLFSPLGCGLMTGSGAVINTARPTSEDTILVTGLGAVGLAAVMAGKIAGCKAVIAVDRVKSRLKLAKEIGATHTFDTSDLDPKSESFGDDFAKKIRDLVGGENARIRYAFETTGVIPLMRAVLKTLTKRGKMYQIGVPITSTTPELPIDIFEFFNNTKRIEGHYLGECMAKDHIPKMIKWYHEGKFPFDKFTKMYPAKDVGQAVEEMKQDVIKPILVH